MSEASSDFQADEALPWLRSLSQQILNVVHGNGPVGVQCWHDLVAGMARIRVTLPQQEVVGGQRDGEHVTTFMCFELLDFMKLLANPAISMTAGQNDDSLCVIVDVTGYAFGSPVTISIELGRGAHRAISKWRLGPDGNQIEGES